MLEAMLVRKWAPTLARIKCANLMTAHFKDCVAFAREVSALRLRMKGYGVTLTILRMDEGSAQLYLYRPAMLRKVLSDQAVREFLSMEGYSAFGVGEALNRLRQRLREGSFPHEIGLFLGYPLSDVQAFIRHRGRGCALCGIWKAYDHVEDAQAYCECCRQCSIRAMNCFQAGQSLEDLIVAG